MHLLPIVATCLSELGIAHDVLECDPDKADTAQFCDFYGIDPADSANTILVSSRKPEGSTVACVALATTRLDVNHKVRELMGVRKVSFSSPDHTMALTGMSIGGVTPFGLPSEMVVLVDAAVMGRERIVMGGGNRSSKLMVAPAALRALESARIVDDLARSYV
jgi:prolyl-tRNA editing enzyme YbaK/EbsC (Cys-tRNA(Pro) deacylase)